jgi:hypothetical protein
MRRGPNHAVTLGAREARGNTLLLIFANDGFYRKCEYRLQDGNVRSCGIVAVRRPPVYASSWLDLPVRGNAQERICLGCERQVTARFRT